MTVLLVVTIIDYSLRPKKKSKDVKLDSVKENNNINN